MEHALRFVLVFALGALGAATAAAHDAVAPPRTVAVGGEGEVTAKPDRARVTMGVTQLGADVKATEADVSKVVRACVAELRALGARDEQLSTSGVSIQPEYVWDEKDRRQRLVGYRVSREITVVVTDLEKLGDVLLRATKSGVNQVQPPLLESSKAKELEQQALVKAAEDARAKARLLAETLGAKLGAVRSIAADDTGPMPPPMPLRGKAMQMEAADSGGTEMGLVTGEIRVRAAVSAEFDLVP